VSCLRLRSGSGSGFPREFRETTDVDHVFEKLRLGKAVGLTISEMKVAVCAGLQSRELARHLRAYDYDSVDDLMERIREQGSYTTERSTIELASGSGKSSVTTTSIGVASVETNRVHGGNVTVKSDTTDGRSRTIPSNIRCYNCGEFGVHFARNCPKEKRPKFCTACHTEGHTRRFCATVPLSLSTESQIIC